MARIYCPKICNVRGQFGCAGKKLYPTAYITARVRSRVVSLIYFYALVFCPLRLFCWFLLSYNALAYLPSYKQLSTEYAACVCRYLNKFFEQILLSRQFPLRNIKTHQNSTLWKCKSLSGILKDFLKLLLHLEIRWRKSKWKGFIRF